MLCLGSRRDSGRREDSKARKEEVAYGQVKLKACRLRLAFLLPQILAQSLGSFKTLFWLS